MTNEYNHSRSCSLSNSSSSSSSPSFQTEAEKLLHSVTGKTCRTVPSVSLLPRYFRCVSKTSTSEGADQDDPASTAVAASVEYVYIGTNVLRQLNLHPCGRLMSSGKIPAVKSVAVSNDGRLVFTAHDDQKIRLWKCRNFPSPSVNSLQFSHVATLPSAKERLLRSLSQGNYVQVRRHHKKLWMQHADTISVLAVARKVLYSGSWDKTVKVWRLSDLKCVESIAAHDDAINGLVTTERDLDGNYLYTASADGSVKVWKAPVVENEKHLQVDCLIGHAKRSSVNTIAISGGLLCSGASDAEIAVWRRPSLDTKRPGSMLHREVGKLKGHSRPVLSLCFSDWGLLLSGSADGTIRAWRLTAEGDADMDAWAPCCIAVLKGHGCAVRSLCMGPQEQEEVGGGVVYSVGSDGGMRVWWLSRELRGRQSLPWR